jgi:MFS transporter, YNFM family, putative membrane transport protein
MPTRQTNAPVLSPSPSIAQPSQTRAIVLLAVAGFASQAMVRSADSLLPQIAHDLAVTIGAASVVVWAYSLVHGSMQLVIGPIGDRFGKYRIVALTCAGAAVFVALCGLTQSLTLLTATRIASAAFAAWIIPMGMAYIGDVVPYARRQPVLARYLSGQITGQLFGQAAGGVLGDWLGWRAVFFVLAGFLAIAAVALLRELTVNPLTRPPDHKARSTSFLRENAVVLANPWARLVIVTAFVEYGVMFGAFAYVGADLFARFKLSFSLVGLIIGTFGIGGLLYAGFAPALVARFGQAGLASLGGIVLAGAYLVLAAAPTWWHAPVAVTLIGLGFYMLHNTLQTNATQMSPQARGTAVGLFSAALYLGQTAGVAALAPVIDRAGAPPVFVAAAMLLAGLGLWFGRQLRRHQVSATP